MDLGKLGAAFLRVLEGVRLRFYWDASTPPVGTIGEGFTWRSAAFRRWWAENKPGVTFGPGATMTREECDDAMMYLARHEYGAAVNRFLGGKTVPQHVFDALFSASFNMGSGSLKWKWAQAARRGDFAEAARLLQTVGRTAGGKVLAGLVKRRREEAELLEHGDYAIGGTLGLTDSLADGILVRGERGAPVEALQRQLAALGFYDQPVDGIFGFGTEAAVIEFQRSRGLTVDGWAGPKTLAALKANTGPIPDIPAPEAPGEGDAESPAAPRGTVTGLLVLGGVVLAVIAYAAARAFGLL